MLDFLNLTFWNNTVGDYLLSAAVLAGGFIVLFILQKVMLSRLLKRVQQTESSVDDVVVKGVARYLSPLLYISVVYLAFALLTLSPALEHIINFLVTALLVLFGALLLSSLLVGLFNRYWVKKNGGDDKMALRWIAVMIRIFIWIAALLLFFDNIGVEITTLVAGLGIGGIAVAFAAQAILEDIFSFITIFFDRPFEIGDFIFVDNLSGTVEHIGIKTTRLRSLNGEQLILSNKDLTSSRLHNYKRMDNRRVLMTISVTYDTTAEQLKVIPELIRSLFEGIESVDFTRAHFSTFAASSLNFEIVYYVLSQDYNLYMDIQQEINLRIKSAFDERGIEFAFPTQTLYVKNERL